MGVVRRAGCLVGLGTLALWAVVLGAAAWFAVQGYQHAMDLKAIGDRTATVGAAWASDPAALAKAATGAAGVRPSGLSAQPFQQVGARPTTAYAASGRTLTLRTTRMSCETAPLTVDVVETSAVVQVLVHVQKPWLPQVRDWWTGLRAPTACVNVAKPTTLTATLGTTLGRRVVVDGVTGTSVRRV